MSTEREAVGAAGAAPLVSPVTIAAPAAAVRQWFERLGRCCAAVDYASARALFAPDVVSFGTKARIVTGIDLLQAQQWEGIWPNIREFQIDLATVHAGGHDCVAWGIATWSSLGVDGDDQPFERPGRASVALERRDGVWLAVHTHFSLVPGTPHQTGR